jgi:hypothetical protein
MEIHAFGTKLVHADSQADGQTDVTKVTGTVCEYTNVTKKTQPGIRRQKKILRRDRSFEPFSTNKIVKQNHKNYSNPCTGLEIT